MIIKNGPNRSNRTFDIEEDLLNLHDSSISIFFKPGHYDILYEH